MPRELCTRGLHPDTPENTAKGWNGGRRCRACRNWHDRAKRIASQFRRQGFVPLVHGCTRSGKYPDEIIEDARRSVACMGCGRYPIEYGEVVLTAHEAGCQIAAIGMNSA